MSTITLDGNVLVVKTPYHAALVDAIKTLPASERKYDPTRRAWLVAPQHGILVAGLIEQFLGEHLTAPATGAIPALPLEQTLEVRYLGSTKERVGETERTASGYCNGAWSVVFPESVLRAWFLNEAQPTEAPTLYGVLSVAKDADAEAIKSAFRRLAKQWHPDVNREPNAAEQFKVINAAYEVLRNPTIRAKYDAGLKLQPEMSQTRKRYDSGRTQYGYRAPLMCGLLVVTAHMIPAGYWVEKIKAWDDITDSWGRTLVTSWPPGGETFVEKWV